MSPETPETIARLRGLLEVTSLARSDAELPSLLASIARAVSETVGFRTVAVALQRPACDAFEVVVVHGGKAARDALLGETQPWDYWAPLLDERFEHAGAYFLPKGAVGWNGGQGYVPEIPTASGPDAWLPEDALLVPMRDPEGVVRGILSVDEPRSGRRPTTEDLELLGALAAHGAQAIASAQQAAEDSRQRQALEQLLRLSTSLPDAPSTEAVLAAVCDAIHRALGFGLAVVEIADRSADRYVPRAAVGLDLADADIQLDVPIAQVDRAFDPAYEIEGCYLLPQADAHARVGASPASFESSMNGRGPRAWQRHWLIVPLRDGDGERMGFIWADDPDDRLLPSGPRLQALRLFADQAEKALHTASQLEERRALIEASPVGILSLDTEGRVRSWNTAARKMFGYADEEVIGHVPPWIDDDIEGFRRRFAEQLGQDVTHSVFSDRRADGTTIDVATTSSPLRGPDGTVTGMIAALADITAQERSKMELAEREAEMRALIQASPIALMALDPQGRVRSWNAGAERIFGWTAEEAIGTMPPQIPGDKRNEFEESLRRALAGESFTGVEQERIRKDGTRIIVSISQAPIRAADGRTTGVITAIADVTERRRNEADLAARNAELEALHETALALNEQLDHEAVLEAVVRRASAILGAGGGFVYLVDEERDVLEVAVDHGAFAASPNYPIARGEGLSGKVWQSGETLAVADYTLWAERMASYEDLGIHALAAVPLRSGSKIVGVLGVGHVDPDLVFGPGECLLLERFGQLASLALENARLYAAERKASETARAIVDGSPVAIFSLDRAGRVATWNAAAERLFGWTAQETIGERPPYLDEQGLHEADERNAEVLAGMTLPPFEVTRLRRDGKPIDLVVSGAPLQAADGTVTGILSMCVDVTEHKRAERELARRKAELEALHETALSLIQRLEPGTLLRDVVARAAELLGTEHGWMYLADGDELVFEVGTGLFGAHEGDRAGTDEGLAGRIFTTGQPLALEDYATWPDRIGRFEGAGFRAVAGVPLFAGSEVIGVLGVAHQDAGRTFDEVELALLGRFGQLASLSLGNARLVEELRRSRELYRSVVENATDMIVLLSPTGVILYASPSHREMLGFEADELVGTSVIEHSHPETTETSKRAVAAAATAASSVAYTTRARHKDGSWVTIEGVLTPVRSDRGELRMILGTARDVTERARIEEERARAQEEILRAKEYSERLIQTANALIVGLDESGRVEVFNEEAERITGWSRYEIQGKDWFEVVVPRGRYPEAWQAFQAWQSGEGALPPAAEHGLVTRRGEERFVSWRHREVAVDGYRGTISFGLDLTDQRQLEEQLRESQKLEAIGRLAGGIAHDFNNLVTAITGYGELALARLDPDEPVRRNVEEMKRAGERAAALTRQLLAFSRRQVLQPKVLDLNAVVSGIDGMLSRLLGEDVALVTSLDPGLGQTRADPGQIEQVIVNLAINARDAMPRGGRLGIETANVELDEDFAATHVGAVPGRYVMLSVSDSGEGMDRETLDRVFEPFFTTKPLGQGTGLGLSTVYGIVKQTGGGIWAYSEPGRGSTFKVYLPRVWEQAENGSAPVAAPSLTGSETILLVEDEKVVRSLVCEMLESSGYSVLEAGDAEEALRVARAHDGPIDLLMTDVVMPGLSGPELARVILTERPALRILFTSGYTEDAIAGHGSLGPGTAFLEKPFTAADLGQSLRAVLDGDARAVA